MKSSIVIAILLASFSCFAQSAENYAGKDIDDQTLGQMKALSERIYNPLIMLFSPLSMKNTGKINNALIPNKVKADSTNWIRKVVHEKWLGPNWESEIIGVKNAKIQEKGNAKIQEKGNAKIQEKGVTSSITKLELTRDIIVLNEKVEGLDIQVCELGDIVSLRVIFPRKNNITSETSVFIENCIREFTNVPTAMKIKEDLVINDYSPLIVAELKSGQTKVRVRHICPEQWWECPFICVGDNFFFIYVFEFTPEDAKGYSPIPKNPRRF